MDFKVELFHWLPESLARLREIAKINTCKIVAIPKSQNFVLANNSNNKVFSAEKSEHPPTSNPNPSDVFMHGSHIPRVTSGLSIQQPGACPGKTTLIMCTPTVRGRLAFCAADNVRSGQSASEDIQRSNSTTARVCPPHVEQGKYNQAGQTSRTILPPAPYCFASNNSDLFCSVLNADCQRRRGFEKD